MNAFSVCRTQYRHCVAQSTNKRMKISGIGKISKAYIYALWHCLPYFDPKLHSEFPKMSIIALLCVYGKQVRMFTRILKLHRHIWIGGWIGHFVIIFIFFLKWKYRFFPSFDCWCCCCYFVHDFAMLRQICVRDIVGNLLNYRLDEALILRSIIIAVFVRMRNCQLFEIHTLFSWFIWTSMGEKERKDEKKRKSSDENRFRFCLLLLTKNPIFINPWT